MLLYVIRHGDPIYDPDSLTELGHEQARALAKRAPILILDDSASALDFATDAALRRSIAGLDYKPTVFIVSQRASSVMHADLILVLDDGTLTDSGTHAELIERCDIYREIYETQFEKEGAR